MVKLSEKSLVEIPLSVGRPTYDRSAITPGIVHIGCGNFHRAHQAWYMESLFRRGLCQDWGIIGAGVRAADAGMRSKLAAQDWMTTLIELSPDGKRAEITGSMIGFAPVEDGNGPLIDAMANPTTRIVTLTVTEGGYYRNSQGDFDASHPDIQHDVDHPNVPRTAFGAIVAALRRRRDAGTGPFTCQSCDNLQGNGDTLRQAVVSLAALVDPALSAWIDSACTFPNSMVDCIVPATGPKEMALALEFGIEDAAPVTHEPFRMWVIEDEFCAGRPEWETVGAIFTDDILGFERAKIRILNGGGQILSPVADLLGLDYVADAMKDPRTARFFRKCEVEEVLPHVREIPGYTPETYLALVEERFSNRAMGDTTRRFAFNGSSKEPGFLLPSVRDALAACAPISGLALTSALWCRYCMGVREDGSEIAPNDPNWDDLRATAQAATSDPGQWLKMTHIYGELGNPSQYSEAFMNWHWIICKQGAGAAIDRYIG